MFCEQYGDRKAIYWLPVLKAGLFIDATQGSLPELRIAAWWAGAAIVPGDRHASPRSWLFDPGPYRGSHRFSASQCREPDPDRGKILE